METYISKKQVTMTRIYSLEKKAHKDLKDYEKKPWS